MIHRLIEIIKFDSKVAGYKDGLPIRETIEPWYRWYCTCGDIGGKARSEEAAQANFDRHVKEKLA